jgi:hypothetical protein
MIKIPLVIYNKLKERDRWLTCLERAGVDSWEGYQDANDIRHLMLLEKYEK